MPNNWYVDSWIDSVRPIKSNIRNGVRDYVMHGHTLATLRALTANGLVWVHVDGVPFKYDAADTTTADDGVTCIVTADSKRYKRVIANRERLTANRTYYVSPTGSDANDGLSVGAPFLTIQKGLDTVAALDIGTFNVTIDIQTGTYTGGAVVNGPWLGSGTVTIQGQQTSMGVGNTIISTTNAHAIACFNGGRVSVRRLDLRTTTSGSCVYANTGGAIYLTGFMVYGPSAFAQLHCDPFGAIYVQADYTINGGGVVHWYSVGGHLNSAGRGIVVFINVTFSSSFAQSDAGGRIVVFSVSFTNGANVTGTRYSATALGLVYTAGGGASYLPGTVAGSTGTGGQYT